MSRLRDEVLKKGHGLLKSLEGLYDFMQALPNLLGETDSITSGASPIALDNTVIKSELTTGGTAGSESITIADGTVVGQRKIVEMVVRTNASDVAVITSSGGGIETAAAAALTSYNLDAVAEFVCLEWTGAKWRSIYGNGTEVV